MSLASGTRIGPYEVTAQIGAGGMGEVYRATDTKLKRQVALKVLPAAVAGDADRLARLQREAEVLAQLNHPNIAAIYGLEDASDAKALVMELVEGPTLADRIAQGALALDEALPIARQMAEALEAAHDQGIVHRDLKPANVKVRADGTVKVLDFGLAKAMDPAAAGVPANVSLLPTITTPAMTRAGMILGTAAYMSPEQAKGQPADRRSDIWAFGCVLFEMLAGRRAFGGEDVIDTLAEVRRAEPAWTALPHDTPAWLRRLLRRCLVKDRRARLADASSIRLEIDETHTAAEASPPAVSPARRYERMAWAAGTLALLLVAAFAIWAATRPVPAVPEIRFDVEVPQTSANPLAVSPDGRLVALIVRGQVWVHPLDGRPARALAGTDGAIERVFWSPDTRAIGFFAQGKLKRIDVETGAVLTLADAPRGAGGAWSRDGLVLFAPTRGPLFRVRESGGAATPVTKVEGPEVRHVSPQFLPDGRHFLFYSAGNPRVSGIYLAALDGGEPPRRLLDVEGSAVYAPGHLLFPRSGALMAQRFDTSRLALVGEPWQVAEGVRVDITQGHTALSASDTGVLVYRKPVFESFDRQLVWVDRAGKNLEEIVIEGGFTGQNPALSPDGRTLAMAAGGIHVVELGRRIPSRLPDSRDQDGFPLWSRDGTQLVFTSVASGVRDLYRVALSGGAAELFLATPGAKVAHDWSPDGRFLLYRDFDPRTSADLLALPVEQAGPGAPITVRTGEKPLPVAATTANEFNGQFSPDGSWVAFESDESGEREVYVQPFGRPGARQRVSSNGGAQVRWRADGGELYFLGPDEKLMAVSVRRVPDGRLEFSDAVPLFEFRTRTALVNAHEYVVTDNGRRFLLNTWTDVRSTFSAIVNWKP